MNLFLLLSLITHTGPPPLTGNQDVYQPRRVQKTAGATGVLLCGDEPLVNTRVALVSLATDYTSEEVFAAAITDEEGHFERCLLAVTIPIPDEYVSRASNINRWFHHRYEIEPTDVSKLKAVSGTCK